MREIFFSKRLFREVQVVHPVSILPEPISNRTLLIRNLQSSIRGEWQLAPLPSSSKEDGGAGGGGVGGWEGD